jgi:alpha-mannosidase
MNNYWGTNFQAWQGGDFTFRYAITSSDRLHPVALTRFGSSALTPLESASVAGSFDQTQLPVEGGSFLKIDNPTVSLSTWKLAEDGDGSILRLQETAGGTAQVAISSPFLTFSRAWDCTLVEDNRSEIPVSDGAIRTTLGPFEVKTIRVRTSSKLAWPMEAQ